MNENESNLLNLVELRLVFKFNKRKSLVACISEMPEFLEECQKIDAISAPDRILLAGLHLLHLTGTTSRLEIWKSMGGWIAKTVI